MKKKSICKRLLSGAVLCLTVLLMLSVSKTSAAEPKHQAKRFNVVFVMDSSGSMGTTDGEKWRFDAVDLFLGLSADTGNYVGAVVFNEGIADTLDMIELDGQQSKLRFSRDLRNQPVDGQTNIGMALLEAVKMLDKSANRELPSAIILLTDGVTQLPSDKIEKAETDKETAIEAADRNFYPVYSVCLNKDSSEAAAELKDISDRTNGVYLNLEKEENIKEVFSQFYNMIYDTETVTIMDESIPENGTLDGSFQIPEFGVEEVNIIISTLNYGTTYQVIPPGRGAFTEEEIERMKISAGPFSVIKVIEPGSGQWKISVTGTPGDSVTIRMVINADYKICLEDEGGELKHNLGDRLALNAYLIDGNVRLEESEIYRKHGAVLLVNHNGKIEKKDMSAQDEGYGLEYKFDDYGLFVFQVSMPINGMEEMSGELKVYVENHAPQVTEADLKWSSWQWLFGEKVYTKDLSLMAADREDAELTYEIVDYDGPPILQPEVISDVQLKIAGESELADVFKGTVKQKGSITLRALDSQGADCEFTMSLSLFTVNILLCRIFAGMAVLFVLLLLARFILSRHKKFNGEITVAAFDNLNGIHERPVTFAPRRGIIALSDYIQEGCGIVLRRTKLRATGKDYIYLRFSKGCYSSCDDKIRKKIRLDDGFEVTVSVDENKESGIKITYHYNGNGAY